MTKFRKKVARMFRTLFYRTFSFVPSVKKRYQKMKDKEKFKADDSYLNVARALKDNVYPNIFEAMEKYSMEEISLNVPGLKKCKLDRHGFWKMEDTETAGGWATFGNAKTDQWCPLICRCYSEKSIKFFPQLAEGLMNKLDELTKHGIKNLELIERAKKFGTVYDKKVLTEKTHT